MIIQLTGSVIIPPRVNFSKGALRKECDAQSLTKKNSSAYPLDRVIGETTGEVPLQSRLIKK